MSQKKKFIPPPHWQCIVKSFTCARHIWRQSISSKLNAHPHTIIINIVVAFVVVVADTIIITRSTTWRLLNIANIVSLYYCPPSNNECIWAMSLPLSMSHFSGSNSLVSTAFYTCRIYRFSLLNLHIYFDVICVSASSHSTCTNICDKLACACAYVWA